jgi:hypothetical protein
MRNDVTPLELKLAMERRGLPTAGVDFELLAQHQNDCSRVVPGWMAPEPGRGWHLIDRDDHGSGRYLHPQSRLTAILSCEVESDGRAWLHLSASHPKRLPSWAEMRIAKETFLGDRRGVTIYPPKREYVNIHEVLHIFALLNPEAETGLPDFTGGTGSL